MAFTIRHFNNKERLGDKLKALRKEANLTLSQMANKTKVRKQILKRLESGQYDKLPDPIYTRNFIKVYLRVLKAEESYYLDLFEQERGTCDFVKQARLPRQRASSLHFIVAQRLIKVGMFGIATASLVFYFGIQVRTIIRPPELMIFEPSDGALTQDATIKVFGQTEKGSNVRVNGTEVLLTNEGMFEVEIALERGLNVIKVEGAKRYSRQVVEYRRVVFDEDRSISLAPRVDK